MTNNMLERIDSPITWAFVLGVVAVICLSKISARMLEISASLNDIRNQQFEMGNKINQLSELVDLISSQISTIESVANDVNTYILPNQHERDAIYRSQNSPP